jgi:hypothetical protein
VVGDHAAITTTKAGGVYELGATNCVREEPVLTTPTHGTVVGMLQDAVDRSQHDDAVVVDVAFGVTNRLCPRTFCLPPTADAEVGCREEQLTAEAITTTYQILA